MLCRLEYDLQFFAKEGPGGEKTEEATSKKLEDARKEGQVCKSMELTNAIALLAAFLTIRIFGLMMGQNFVNIFRFIYQGIPDSITYWAGDIPVKQVDRLMITVMLRMIIMLLPVFLVGFLVSVVVNILQVKWKVTTKPLQPKFSKLNPVNGMKRLFSKEKLVELLKSILKVGLISYIVYSYMRDRLGMLLLMPDYDILAAVGLVVKTVLDVAIRVALIYLLIGIGDYIYQRHKFREDMKMTKQEVKDEYKDAEGDPQIKGKIRQKMAEASRRRMMQSVPEADVVITNPTHYAVALKYDTEISDAPFVTAKGQDFLAQKIKELAAEGGVEIVENKPLARMLYHNVDVGAAIPPELYQAVAEVLAFVYHLREDRNSA
ncbi:MAG: flagellar biosynthesis protein FlhB [Lachnospiraceae bacterium]|nr:flagellar biosynthesis protein FlhB [Lachnospiraceae bacterium]